MKRFFWLVLIFSMTMQMSWPLLAADVGISNGAGSVVNGADTKEPPMSQTLDRLRLQRTRLVEAQNEVVIQANGAKRRIQDILDQSVADKKALSLEQLEKLKEDLSAIKSNQEILNTIQADIKEAASKDEELMPSRDYMDKLIKLYGEKAAQLKDIAKALANVAG